MGTGDCRGVSSGGGAGTRGAATPGEAPAFVSDKSRSNSKAPPNGRDLVGDGGGAAGGNSSIASLKSNSNSRLALFCL